MAEERSTFPPKTTCWWIEERADVRQRLVELETACESLKSTLTDLDKAFAIMKIKLAAYALVGGVIGSLADSIVKYVKG